MLTFATAGNCDAHDATEDAANDGESDHSSNALILEAGRTTTRAGTERGSFVFLLLFLFVAKVSENVLWWSKFSIYFLDIDSIFIL